MALATQCPFCQTTFRVAQDQLKLRGGLVRCGNCREVFNGNDYLVAPEVAQQLEITPPPQSQPQPSPASITPAVPAASATTAPASAWPPLPNAGTSTTAAAKPAKAPATTPAATSASSTTSAAVPAPAAPATPTAARMAAPDLSATFASIAAETSDAPWGDGSDTPTALPAPSAIKSAPVAPAPESATINTLTQKLSLPIPRTLSAPEKNDSTRDAEAAALDKAPNDLATETKAPTGLLKQPTRTEDPVPAQLSESTADQSDQQGYDDEERDETLHDDDLEEPTEDEEDAPGFVQRAERRERLGRILGVVMAIGVVLLSISLLLQALYLGRNQIAAWLPTTRPLLSAACARLHCTVGLPANIEQLSLESNELQLVPPNQNIYTLTVLLRNRSASTQTWPYLELTLNDNDEKPITRRVFTPREYLSSVPQANAGFGGNSEQQVKLNFELTQPVASGYRVYLFYP